MALLDDIRSSSSMDEAIKIAIRCIREMRSEYDWIGVYQYDGDMLTLQDDHYIGPTTTEIAIPLDAGICGAAATLRETIIIDDVKNDPRYIACSISVQSEIVVPILAGDELVGVLDLDSDTFAAFNEEDQRELEAFANTLAEVWADQE